MCAKKEAEAGEDGLVKNSMGDANIKAAGEAQSAPTSPENSEFNPDKPIEEFSQDRLGRADFARSLARSLAKYDRPESLTIGLYGAWGIGKTSVINLAQKAIPDYSDPPPIIIPFNPWYFSDREHLIRQFLEVLSTEIGLKGKDKTYKRAARIVSNISKGFEPLAALLPLPWLAPLVKLGSRMGIAKLSELAEKAGSLESVKAEISKALAEGRRRVVIVIDDIDRLSAAEMATMFQAVKALADFEYTTYLMAFDETVVTDALNRVQDGHGAEYLEKIVSVVRHIPPIPQARIRAVTIEALNEFAAAHPSEAWSNESRGAALMTYLSKACRTLRHLHRLANALYADISAMNGEVDGLDFVGITALRILSPNTYYFVRDNREFFIDTDETLIDIRASDDVARSAIEAFLAETNRPSELKELLESLFPRLDRSPGTRSSGDDRTEWRLGRRICDPDSFDVYFQLTVPNTDISNARMQAILNSLSASSLRAALLSFVDESVDKGINFLERLQDYYDDDRVQRHIQDIVTVLFDVGDRFPQDIRGFPIRLDGGTLIMQIVYQLLRRIDREQTRYEVFDTALNAAQESLCPLVTSVSLEDSAHGRFSSKPNPEHQLVSDASLDILESAACAKIEEWAKGEGGGRLAEHQRLIYILFRWVEWGDHDTVEDYILNRLGDANFTQLIVKLAENERQARIGGGPVSLDHDNIRTLVDPNKARRRITNILNGPDLSSLSPTVQQSLRELERNGGKRVTASPSTRFDSLPQP